MNLTDDLLYYEYVFDSNSATESYSTSQTPQNYPSFKMANPLNNIVGLKVVSAEIPLAFYTINSLNNTFIVNYNGGGNTTVTITPGNYSSTSLRTALETALDVINSSFTVTINTVTSKYVFAAATDFVFTFSSLDTSLALFLGFGVGSFSSTTSSLTAPNVFSVTGASYLYLCSNKLGNLVQLHLPIGDESSKGGFGPQIAKIPISENPFSVLCWIDPNPELYFNLFNLFQLQNLDFYLTLGTSSTPLDLNGLGFSLKLGITTAAYSGELVSKGVKRLKM